ncbi:MAG TPA: hypothetical protein EYQ25_08245 [Planctomycetes bacterium]|nr:hypothetical protein [Planctomycetota bacterium]HIL38371.1 hypothetical protein [Planctomycetota bacterium]
MTPSSADSFEGSADPFPREDLTARIANAGRQELRRQTWQAWLLGIGVALIALAIPMERLWGEMNLVQTAAEGGRGLGIGVPLLRFGTKWISHEQAAFAMAAISAGLTVPALRSLLLTIGFSNAIAMRGVGLMLLAPLQLLGATSAVLLAPGVLGATLIARELFRLDKDQSMRALWRVSSVFVLGLLLDPANLLLLPAAGLALIPLAAPRKLPPWAPPAGLTLTIGFCVFILLGAGEPDALDQLLRTMLAGGKGPSLVSLGAWLIWLPISLGVGWLGILSLIAGKRTAEEAPPPAWTRAWCLVAIAPVIGGTPLTMPTLGLLLPLTAVGLVDHLARMEREDKMRRRASLLLVSQLILGVLAWGTLTATDPLTAWREEAQETLDPEDLVFSAHPGHLYLLKHRYGIASWDPKGPEASKRALEATNQGQRVVLDGVLPDASPQLKAAATVVIGQPDG